MREFILYITYIIQYNILHYHSIHQNYHFTRACITLTWTIIPYIPSKYHQTNKTSQTRKKNKNYARPIIPTTDLHTKITPFRLMNNMFWTSSQNTSEPISITCKHPNMQPKTYSTSNQCNTFKTLRHLKSSCPKRSSNPKISQLPNSL